MNGSFASQSRNFGELLGQSQQLRVMVPLFQRGYSWLKSHIAAFWADLIEFHNESGQHNTTERYFLGPIVILPEGDKITLLDGQQRLATATILFSVLRDHARKLGTQAAHDLDLTELLYQAH